MADYRDKLDEWREAARRKAREEAARVGEEFDLNEHAEAGREHAREAREQAARAADEAARLAREVGGRVREAGQKAGERAEDFIGGAKKYYKGAARAAGVGARFAGLGVRATRLTAASTAGLYRVYDWARQNPKQAIVVTLSLAAGVRAGAASPGLDGFLLGGHP